MDIRSAHKLLPGVVVQYIKKRFVIERNLRLEHAAWIKDIQGNSQKVQWSYISFLGKQSRYCEKPRGRRRRKEAFI